VIDDEMCPCNCGLSAREAREVDEPVPADTNPTPPAVGAEVEQLRTRVAALEAGRTALLAEIGKLSRGWHNVCCTRQPGHDKAHRSVNQHGYPSMWVTIHATEEQAVEQVAIELTEMTRHAETAEARAAELETALASAEETAADRGQDALHWRERAETAEAQTARVRALLTGRPCRCSGRGSLGHTGICPTQIVKVAHVERALEVPSNQAKPLEPQAEGPSDLSSRAASSPRTADGRLVLDREPGTAEHGSWRPEIFAVVDALRGLDWTGFNPARLDDLADVAGMIAGTLWPPPPLETLNSQPAPSSAKPGRSLGLDLDDPTRCQTSYALSAFRWACRLPRGHEGEHAEGDYRWADGVGTLRQAAMGPEQP